MKNKIFMFIMFTFVMMLVSTYRVEAKVTDKGYTLYINGVKATDNVIFEGYVIRYTIKDSNGNHVNFRYADENGSNRARYERSGNYTLMGRILDYTETMNLVTESGKKLNFSFQVNCKSNFHT